MRLPRWRQPLRGQRWWLLVVPLAALATGITTCTARRPVPSLATPLVAVALAQSRQQIVLEIDGPYDVRDASGEVVARGGRLAPGLVRTAGVGRVELNGVALGAGEFTLHPRTEGATIAVEDAEYGGYLRVRSAGREVEVHNVLDIETYVAGVLFCEMPASFPVEALKAQCVAARSYAQYKLQRGGGALQPTEADQVYGGIGTQAARARTVVAATRGLVLENAGHLFPTYYSSTCGGATSAALDVFAEDHPVMTGTRCEWCQASPLYRWQRTVDLAVLLPRMRLKTDIGRLLELTYEKDRAGRARRVTLRGPRGAETLAALHFRSRFNAGAGPLAEQLPSMYLLGVKRAGPGLQIDGAGYGHGVGMCQYGAAGLAAAGHDFREILQYYYRGAQLRQRW